MREKIFWLHRGGKDKNNLYVQACKLSDIFRLLCCTATSIIPLYIILIRALLYVILYFNISHDDNNIKYKIKREKEREFIWKVNFKFPSFFNKANNFSIEY